MSLSGSIIHGIRRYQVLTEIYDSPADVANRWHDFLKNKFSETEQEKTRPPMDPIPDDRKVEDQLSRAEFERAVNRLNSHKATGPDGIPAEVYKHCPEIREELFLLIKYIWDNEAMPTCKRNGSQVQNAIQKQGFFG